MSNRKSTMFFGLLLVVIASIVAGMVLAARLDLSSSSSAQTVAVPAMNTAPLTGPVTATTFRDIAKLASPAVVNIRTESRRRTQELNEFFGGGGSGDLFERFFGQPGPNGNGRPPQRPQQREEPVQSAGTGFIIDKAGLILTNNHVVEGATKIVVSLYGEDDGQEYAAKIVGRDPLTDSALIELTEKPTHTLPEIKFGDSSQMQPGDWVMAIGNPFNLAHTVSVGVVSGISRPFESVTDRNTPVIQTDAAINPGNSGGPLLNVRGEVIGINTAIITDGRQGNLGIGFAVPINTVRDLLPQLRSGKVTRGLIGVRVRPVPRDAVDELGLKSRDGALVDSVGAGGPAAKAGVKAGDVITSFNGRAVKDSEQLPQMVTATAPGTTVSLRIVRDGAERTLSLVLGEVDLDAESGVRRTVTGASAEPEPETSSDFGISISNVTPQIARQLRIDAQRGAVIVDVDAGGPGARGGLRPGDLIVRVGRTEVSSAAEAQRELAKVPARGTALIVVSRIVNQEGERAESFVTVTKE